MPLFTICTNSLDTGFHEVHHLVGNYSKLPKLMDRIDLGEYHDSTLAVSAARARWPSLELGTALTVRTHWMSRRLWALCIVLESTYTKSD